MVTGNLEAVLPSEFRLLLGCHLSKHQPWPSLHHLDSVPGFACFFLPRLSLFLGPGSPASKAWRDQDQGVYLVWAMELSVVKQLWGNLATTRADLSQSCLLVIQLCPTLYNPMDCSPPGSSVHGKRKNTGVGCHSLLQGVFLTQRLNLGLPHCRQILYHLSP